MCFRVRHDFGITRDPSQDDVLSSGVTEDERETLRREMRRLYEEVGGYGYYCWPTSHWPKLKEAK